MQLRWYQEEAVTALFEYFATHPTGNPLVALPTATGKSVVIGTFCHRALAWYPSTRVLMLTHVKELIEQNFDKLRAVWPQAPAGVYSAGLGRKELNRPLTFAGVQSIYNIVDEAPAVDLILIDEAHLVGPDEETRYQYVIAAYRAKNPHVKVAGFTATWWRKKQGALTNDGLFTDIAYDRTKPDDFRQFIAEGYLSPLIARATQTKLDVTDVGMVGGEYNLKQLEAAVDNETVTHNALREVCANGADRRAWLMFCSGISHAEHVADLLNKWGIRTGFVHSKMPSRERDAVIRDWYAGRLRCVTNNNVLTTGIDYPALDLIGMLRPTQSSSLWVQMLGRGMRIAPGKHNCLVLDFAGNTARLGPVDDPLIPGKPRPKEAGDAPVKICPACNCYNHASVRYCEICGQEFPRVEMLSAHASEAPLMTSDIPIIETFPVTQVSYANYLSKKENHTLRITYFSGLRAFHEYINIEGSGFAKHRAGEWWKQRHHSEPPDTIEHALLLTSQLRVPTRVRVWINKQYPEVVSHEWH